MFVDWFTVVAQALNFGVLVWLLKRFLYGPVLRAIDAREARIAAELADADTQKAEAQREREVLQRKNEAFDEDKEALRSDAVDEVSAERKRLLDEARREVDALRAERQEALRSEAQTLGQAIRERTQEEVFSIARRALVDLAGASLEERMTEVFITRLRAMDGGAKAALAKAVTGASSPLAVRTAFELPAPQRAALRAALKDTFAVDRPIRFETAPGLVSGIELTTHGQRVAWSIADYLTSLERGVGELLDEEASTAAPRERPALKAAAEEGANERRA